MCPSYDDIEQVQQEAVSWIWLSRPERKNALGHDTTAHLIEMLEYLDRQDDVRAIVISGRGDAFCAGGDFKDTFSNGAERSIPEWEERVRTGPSRFAKLVRQLSKPVIAAVNGVAVGGGATIALACDIRIASHNARFSFPFSKIGLTPEFGSSYLLPRVVGMGAALELLLLGDLIDAATAYRIGLVSRVLAPEVLIEETQALAATLAARSPDSIRHIKRQLDKANHCDFDAMLEDEAVTLAQAFKSDYHRAAVDAFLSRRR